MVIILAFAGEYDLSVKEQMRIELKALVTEPAVLIDLTQVDYIDSSILTEIILFQRLRTTHELQPAGVVIGSKTPLSRLFEVVNASTLFPVFESIGDAMPVERAAEVRYGFSGEVSDEDPSPSDLPDATSTG